MKRIEKNFYVNKKFYLRLQYTVNKYIESGNNINKLSKKVGLSFTTIKRYLDGEMTPSLENIMKLTKELNVSLMWLLGEENNSKNYTIPRYNISLSAGGGTFTDSLQEVAEHIPISQEFLETKLHRRSVKDLVILSVQGDSMVPSLYNNDYVIADIDQNQVIKDGIYAIQMSNSYMVKRIQKTYEGYKIISDNTRFYTPEMFRFEEMEQANFSIIGKIILLISFSRF